MSPSLPFFRIPKTAQLVVVTDLEQESFPVIHLKNYFPEGILLSFHHEILKLVIGKRRIKTSKVLFI